MNDLGGLVENTLEFFAPLAQENGQTLEFRSKKTEEYLLLCDKSMVQQMLANIIGNAIVHGGSGISIDVRLLDHPETIDIIVEDTGGGIPDSQRDEVFELFKRLDNARSKPGSGLGLALVKAVADHHQAVITLSATTPGSVEHQGLRVTVSFPKRQLQQ